MRGGIRFGLFSLLLFFTILSVGYEAYANEADYEWSENEDGTVTITKYKGSARNVIIPNQLNNRDVTAIGNKAFYNKSLASVEFPNTIVSIGDEAFQYNNLVSVTLQNGLEQIGDYAFGNNKLTSIELPDSLIHIGKYGFIHNSLSTLIIPDSVSDIGFQAFGYNKLTILMLPNGITSVGQWSFAYNQIASLTIPDSMTKIDQYAFAYNKLTAVTLPKSVIKIDDYAFTGNMQLSEVRILSSTTQLSSVSFPNIGSQLTIYGHANSTAQLHVQYNSLYKGYLFEPFTNRVVYDGNGHSGGNVPIDDNLYVRREQATVLGNTGMLEREGYRFDGWNSAADGSGEDYAVNSQVTIGEENVVLFAKWVPEDARAPVITDASTAEDTQSTSGLIITPHPEESGNVMHYKISAIVGGTLYKNNGVTQIHSGDFITTSEGGAGLKFTPEADANSPAGDVFSFQVQATHDNAGAGLSPPAHVSITVSEVNDPPVAVNDTLPKVAKAGGKVVIAFADLLMNDSAGPANESSQSLTIINVDNAVGGTVAIVNGQIEFDLDPTFAGTARFSYTVQDDGTTNGIDDFKTASAIVSFEVNPKPTEPPVVSSVESLDDIEVSQGTERSALSLPSTVQVTLSDQSIRNLGVTWDDGNPVYNGNTDGEYTFTGNLAQDVSNPQGLTAEVKVVVNPKSAEPPVVSSVESLGDIEVAYGTERSELPFSPTVQVTLSDQTNRNLSVTWDEGSPLYNGNTAGEYTFTGTLSQDVSNPQNLTAEVKVIVHPKPAEPLVVESVESQDDIEVSYGTERSSLPLPSTIQVTLSDQSSRSLGVTWDDGTPEYDGNAAGEYTFTGTLAQDVSNPQGLTVEVKVIVNPKPAEPPVVSSVESLNDIEVAYGTERSALPLPPTVQVTLSDQTCQSLGVTWDGGNPVYIGNTAGEYTFTGTLAQDVSNPQGLRAEVKVVMHPKPAKPPVVSSVESLGNIEVSYGTERSALPLPSTVQVTLSDQTSRSLGVMWDDGNPAYNGNTAGEYTFTGNLAQDVSNPQGLTAEVKVVVRTSVPDPKSPIWPSGSKLMVSDITKTSVKLSWPEAQDTNGVIVYRIYVDSREHQTVTGSVYEQTVTGLKAGTFYTFTVKAFNAIGNESEPLSAKATTARSSSGGGGGGSGSGSGGGRVLSSNTDLADLQVWVGGKKLKLSPSFDSGTTGYTARTEAEQIEIVAKEAHSAAKVILKDKVITDRTKANLDEGDNTFVLTVQAENGTKKKYTLTIYRETPKRSEPVIEFTDIAGHWAESNIKRAAAKGIVSGYPDGTFKPNHPVTRVEFTVMLFGALQLEEDGATLTFTDQDQIGTWAKQTVAKAVKAGIVSGYGDGSFRPNAQITRAEMAVMIARALKLPLNANIVTGFTDDESIPQWAKGAVEAIRGIGIVDGRGGNRFVPNEKATRAEAAVILLRMIERGK
ncbi:Ig-like domain-containing protein [Paenibacillus azoreducens]|uniref:Ig-like domain-containing protein n=1 Tax=Paenibacillus azoreducens TaxID=116718 RepID=UPI0039F4A66B